MFHHSKLKQKHTKKHRLLSEHNMRQMKLLLTLMNHVPIHVIA